MPLSAQHEKPTRVRFWVLAVLCSLSFLTYLDRICIMRTQGEIDRDLRLGVLSENRELSLRAQGLENDDKERGRLSKEQSTERMSWVFSAFVAGYLLFEIPAGWLGDRWGARAVLVRIVLWWSLFTGLTGGAQHIARWFSDDPRPEHALAVMIGIRFLFGVGEAGAYPNIARALGRWFPFHERATAQSFVWFSSRMGGALAPSIIGGLMAFGGGWKQAFGLLGLLGVLWAAVFAWWFRDRPEAMPAVNAAERRWIASEQAGAGSIYDDDAAVPMRWASLVSPNVLALCVASFCVSFCFYFYITFLPKYLKDQFGVDYGASQWLSGLPLLVGGGACLVGGKLSDWAILKTGSRRWGRSMIPMIGWTLAGVCALAVPSFHSATTVLCVLAAGFAFQDLGVPSMWSVPADIGGRYAGTVGGCMNTAGALGGMLSPLIAAKVSIAVGWNSAFLMFGVVYLVGAMAWLRVDACRPVFSVPGEQPS